MGGKASLLLVMGFSFILAYISFNLNRYATSAVNNMSSYNEATASHNLAITGANVMLSKFYQDSTLRGTFTESFDTTHGGNLIGSFTATISDVGFDKILLRSISNYPRGLFGEALHDTIEVYFDRLKKNSFTLFAWMTNFDGNDNFWVTGDTASGRVHTNGNLHIDGTPVFWDKVTASKGMNPKPGVGANKGVFKGGYETGVATIDFPNDLKQVSDYAAKYYTDTGEKWMTLNPGSSADKDGYVLVRETETGPVLDSININDPSFSGVLFANGNLHVKGTLDGALTIGTLSDVIIEDNIKYESDPFDATTPTNDVLGLVAENNVRIAENSATMGNVHVDASIFTRTGSFLADDVTGRGLNGQLTVHGSIVQYTKGPVATFSGSTRKTGFAKNYRFDERLADPSFRPPHYPGYYTKTLAISNWWESYRVNRPQD